MNIFGTSEGKVTVPDTGKVDLTDEAHDAISASMDELERRMIQQSFALRDVEIVIAQAKAKGKLEAMQMNGVGAATSARAAREALDASLMLIDRIRKGLQANQELRRTVALLREQNQRLSGMPS